MHRCPAALLLVVFSMLSGCQRPLPTSVPLDPALKTLLPPDTVAAMGFRVDALKQTPAWDRYITQRKLPWVEQFVHDTGLDPRQDLYEVVACLTREGPLMLVRGKFSPDQREPRLPDRPGATRFPYKSYTLLGDERQALTFLNTSVAVAGTTSQVKRVIDLRDGRPQPPATLLALLDTIPYATQVWGVAQNGAIPLPMSIPQDGNAANLTRLFRSLETSTLALDLRNGLQAKLVGQCINDEEAKRLDGTLRGIFGLARLSTPSDRTDLLALYDNLRVTTQGKTVNVTAQASLDALESLSRLGAELGNGRRAR